MPKGKQQENKRKSVKVKLRAEWGIYSWCLVLAVILWVLTGLSDTYISNINVKTNYSNIPKDKVYLHPLPSDLKVQVQASGWDLFTMWVLGSKEEVNIDMSQYAKKSFIAANARLKEELRARLAHKMNIISIDPDTIYLSREPKMSRRVPVVLKLTINCDNEYGVSDKIKLKPEFVTISGPQSLVRQVQFIETRDSIIDDLDKTGTYTVDLKQPQFSSLSIDSSSIKVVIPVGELVEMKTSVPVSVINKHGKNIHGSPEKVTVFYQVTKNREKRTRTTLFEAIVDASKTDSAGNAPLKVQLVNHPDYTYNFRIKPETIKLISK